MMHVSDLIEIIDAYKEAAGVARDTTVSHRVFGDTKKVTMLRGGSDLTTARFNDALVWLRENWPQGHAMPPLLVGLPTPDGEAA